MQEHSRRNRWLTAALVLHLLGTISCSSTQKNSLTVHEGTSMAVALSPNGKSLAIDLLGSLWILSSEGGIARQITDQSNDIRQPTWFPDGKTLAFQSYKHGFWDIVTLSVDGTNWRQLTHGPFDDREPQVSPNGKYVAFSSDRGGSYDIWTINPNSGELKQWTDNPDNEFMPNWSADGRLAFVSDRSPKNVMRSVSDRGRALPAPSIWTVTAEGNQKLLLQGNPSVDAPFSVPSSLNAPSWSPEGNDIVYNLVDNQGSRLFLSDTPLTFDEDVFPFPVQWSSPHTFFYTADGHIKKRSLKTNEVQTIELEAHISLPRHTYQRKKRNFASDVKRPVRGIMKPVISPVADQIAFVALGDLWLAPINGKPQRITHDQFVEMDPAWSPNGDHLVFSSDRAGSMDLWLHNLKTGRQQRLTSLPSSERAAAWSPDATRIAFLNHQNQLLIVNIANKNLKTLRSALPGPGHPSWSADGKTITVSALRPYSTRFREGTNQILNISVDKNFDRYFSPVPHHSVGTRGWANGPLWSPDGTMMAYTAEGFLWILPVSSTGEPIAPPRQITSELSDSPSWTGDSKNLLYQSVDQLKMVSVKSGSNKKISLEIDWTQSIPDDSFVIHAGRLFDGHQPTIRTNVDILIEKNRIQGIHPHRNQLHGNNVIDASDMTVMPGLIESHAHHRKWYGQLLGRLWLSYGITTVQTMGGNPYEYLEDLESFESRTRLGPRIFFTGNPFDGVRSRDMHIDTEDQLVMQLERARILNYDLIKTYVRLPDLLQKKVVNIAHQYGIAVSSHELYPAVSYGIDNVAHLGATSRRGYSPKISALNHSYQDVTDLITQSDVTLTSTLAVDGFPAMVAHDPNALDDPRFVQLNPTWKVVETRSRVAQAGNMNFRKELLKTAGQTIVKIVNAGGRVIAGTDAPIVPYGLSLHAELDSYVRYGLSPFQALQAATWIPAQALGIDQDLGTLKTGKLADMIIVEGNPLRNIQDARKIRQVIKNGEVFDLDDLLNTN